VIKTIARRRNNSLDLHKLCGINSAITGIYRLQQREHTP